MVWYFLVIAIINLGAGALLAMYATRRSLALIRAEAALIESLAEEDSDAGGEQIEQTTAAELPDEDIEPPQPDEPQPADKTPEPEAPDLPPASEETIASLTDDIEPIDKAPEPAPVEESALAEEPAEPEAPDLPPADEETVASLLDDVEAAISGTPDEERSSAGGVVRELKDHVRQFNDSLAEHDIQLRDEQTHESPKNVESCLQALRKANDDHTATLEQVKSSLETLGDEAVETRTLLDDLFASGEKQIEQIKQANEVVEQFDYEGDLGDGCQQMVDVTTKLLSANHQMRDNVDKTMAELARYEGRLGSADSLARLDPLTGVIDRMGLEAHLRQLWEDDPQRQNRLAIGMLDLDNFSKVNEQFGPATGDRILRAFGNMLSSASGDETKIARVAGQRFAVVIPEADLRLATEEVERLRQSAAAMKFSSGDEEIQVTVSCAVMCVGSDDTSDSLFSRCDTTIQEAKSFGRNRTFSHGGEYPTAVVPSKLTLEEQLVSV